MEGAHGMRVEQVMATASPGADGVDLACTEPAPFVVVPCLQKCVHWSAWLMGRCSCRESGRAYAF